MENPPVRSSLFRDMRYFDGPPASFLAQSRLEKRSGGAFIAIALRPKQIKTDISLHCVKAPSHRFFKKVKGGHSLRGCHLLDSRLQLRCDPARRDLPLPPSDGVDRDAAARRAHHKDFGRVQHVGELVDALRGGTA